MSTGLPVWLVPVTDRVVLLCCSVEIMSGSRYTIRVEHWLDKLLNSTVITIQGAGYAGIHHHRRTMG